MKKFLLFFVLLAVVLVPHFASAAGPLVPCGNEGEKACTLSDFSQLIVNVYNLILEIATPLAVLMILIGGVVLLVSGGNPQWQSTAKNMIKWTIIAILLIWGAYLIIDSLFIALGYQPKMPWKQLPF